MKNVYSGSFEGIRAKTVTVETSFSKGLPSFSIVGLGSVSIQESKERIKSALYANDYVFPPCGSSLTYRLLTASQKAHILIFAGHS